MDFRQIQTFICVYDEKNITKAAAKLNIVQPAVSTQLRKLEDALGVQLFERTTRGLVPTDAGQAIYNLYLPIMSEFRQARQRALELAGKRPGQVVIGLNPSVTGTVLASTLRHYQSRFPGVDIQVCEEPSDSLTAQLAVGNLDAAVITFTGPRNGVAFHPLIDEELVFVQRSPDGSGMGQPVGYADVLDRRLILPRVRQGYRLLLDQAAEEIGRIPQPCLEINSPGPVFELLADSDMGTLMPMIIALRAAKTLPLQVSRIVEPGLSRKLGYIHREQRAPSPLIRELIACLKEHLDEALTEGDLLPRSD